VQVAPEPEDGSGDLGPALPVERRDERAVQLDEGQGQQRDQ
jgi:hypothetical protein